MNADRIRLQLTLWLIWVAANAVGVACGWFLGESAGQAIGQAMGYEIGRAIAWAIFEICVWIMRLAVLLHGRESTAWRSIDLVIWLVVEAFGWLLGEGIDQLAGLRWNTSGPVWAMELGGTIWTVIWFMRQSKPSTWWPIITVFWTLFGFSVGSAVMSVGLVVSLEAGQMVSRTAGPVVGWAMSGVVLGSFVGGITGLIFMRLRRWPIPEN